MKFARTHSRSWSKPRWPLRPHTHKQTLIVSREPHFAQGQALVSTACTQHAMIACSRAVANTLAASTQHHARATN